MESIIIALLLICLVRSMISIGCTIRAIKRKRERIPMSESKYKTQIKNLRKNYVRFPLDLKPDVLEAYKAACKANGTTPTTEIKKFIAAYIAEHQAAE